MARPYRTMKILSHAWRRGGRLAGVRAAAAMLVVGFLSYASHDAFARGGVRRHRMALAKLWPINR
jgi:hypothetical protein